MNYLYTIVCCCLFTIQPASAHESVSVSQLVAAANHFLQSLDEEQRLQGQMTFEQEDRTDWHYFPKKRKGLALRDMTEKQQQQSQVLLQSALSESGAEKVRGIIAAERVLWEQSNHSENRHPGRYHFTVFGEPAENGNWGLSMEGHHLSINVTVIAGKEVYVTPSFFGSNPDVLGDGADQGLRPLWGEYEQAFQLLTMLNEDQLQQAVISKKPIREIVTKAKRQVDALEWKGLPAADINQHQMQQLMQLIREYVGRYRAELAQDDLAKIEAHGLDKIHFAWAGSTEAGQPVYYRIQGPSFIMEYANTQNGGNHAHTVWRDFENDFGYDALGEHLESEH